VSSAQKSASTSRGENLRHAQRRIASQRDHDRRYPRNDLICENHDEENWSCSHNHRRGRHRVRTISVVTAPKSLATLAAIASVVILGVKLVAWWWTKSDAVLSDALESIVNVAASLMTLWAVRMSAVPPDEDHPYGHGRVEFISAAIEGGMLVAAGAFVLMHAIRSILERQEPITNTGWGIALMLGGGLINLALAVILIRAGRRNQSSALTADGLHLLSDSITTGAVIASLVAVRLLDVWWIDPAVAICLGLVLIVMGARIALRSVDLLIDRQDDRDVRALRELLSSHLPGGSATPTICSFHKVRCRHDGRDHWIDMHIRLPRDMSVEESHDIASLIEAQALNALGGVGDATAHCEPCRETDCACSRRSSAS